LVGWATAFAAFAGVAGACTSTVSHPPDLGDCTGTEVSCPAPVVAGGGGGGSGADSGAAGGACSVSPLDSQCTQCANGSCCSAYLACADDVDCQNLSSCEENCGGASACISACEGQSPKGIDTLTTLSDCVTVKCPVCTQSGVGDPCDGAASVCNAGLSCPGLWCTKACARSSDCVGLGADGGNALNLPNACIESAASGETCTPGCAVDADCVDFPGTFCFATTSVDGLSVHVCAPSPDAGSD
jgi:hypothetical protein